MKKVIIIAEAGVNHNGDIKKALELIQVAANAKVDYIKFQTFITEDNISQEAPKANYQNSNTDTSESQFDMVKKLELTFDDFRMLKKECERQNVKFLSTAFDFKSVDFLDSLNLDFFKIPSGEITNKPLIEYIAKKGKKVILSTGMATLAEIEAAINLLINNGLEKTDVIVLHCNTEYPTPMKDVNLHAMQLIKSKFGVEIGYSDHTLGIEIPIAAVALGAKVIEKHFTLDRNLPGPDHLASLEPKELCEMTHSIRNVEVAIGGTGIKEPSESEYKNIKIARKSIHFSKSLSSNHIISDKDLIMKRPGDGVSPMEIDLVIGKKLVVSVVEGEKFKWENIQ